MKSPYSLDDTLDESEIMEAAYALSARVTAVLAVLAGCAGSDRPRLDTSEVAKAAGAAQVSAGVVTEYPPPTSDSLRLTFDSVPPDESPKGFLFGRTGEGPVGRWIVRPSATAPSRPNVLAQVDADPTSDRFPVAVTEAFSVRDVEVSVRCRPMSGRVDQACGLVFRYQDENNYYVTRANALEENVRLYHVKNGRRREIASWRGPVARGEWHQLAVRAIGDQISVWWDDRQVITKRDETFMNAGRVGLWLKADSYTEYDDLIARNIMTPGQPR